MFAIIATGGKQFKVTNGDNIFVEKLDAQEGAQVSFDVLAYSDDEGNVQVGKPVVDGVKVEGKVVRHGRGKKIKIFKYKAKKTTARRQGHRQPYTMVEITNIG